MTEPLFVGIDVGTSSTKAVALARSGTPLAVAAQTYPVATPRPGWAEQDPDAWVAAACATVHHVLGEVGIDPDAVRALSFSGQMHGTVCVRADGEPQRPAIIWADQRSSAEVTSVVAQVGRDNLAAWIGNPLATGFMLPTWLWLRRHKPETLGATRWLLLPKDYVRYRLTGEIGTEPSDAASTGLFNPVTRAWSQPLLDALELDASVLPPVASSTAVAGGLRADLAAAMGLKPGTPVVFGGSDQAVQALGNGVVTPGVVSSTIGTGGQLFAPTQRPIVDTPTADQPGLRLHSFCHVLPELWHVETAMLSAGLSLRWLRDQLLDGVSCQAMADGAMAVPPGAEGLLFQPYLAGERTPHMDPAARGSFVGLTRRHGRDHLVRAVMEGVVFGMRQGLELLTTLGVPVETIVASGGATAHSLWLQLQADIYNRAIHLTKTTEAAATGAAMLAGIGVGAYESAEAAIDAVVRWSDHTVSPALDRVDLYERHYERYRTLYPALAEIDHALDAFAHAHATAE